MGALALALSFSACQNKSPKSEAETGRSSAETSSDTSQMNTDTTSKSSPVMAAMDNMMKDMHQLEMTGNTDYDLISTLKTHHQGAIDMGKAELESGTNPKLKEIAQKIVNKQSKEKDMLENMLTKADKSKKDYDPANKSSGLGKGMNDTMLKMMDMNHESAASLYQEFATMMIKHHKDGIQMANTVVKYSKMEDLKAMAKKMPDEQSKEITELEQAMRGQ
jgi:uncharacterized protein (DUF305 family)